MASEDTSSDSNSGDYPRASGAAALGARLRRLSERIDRDAGRLYAALDVRFEQRWFGVLNQLVLHGPRSVGDLAAALGVTHVAVSQVRQALVAEGLVAEDRDPRDGRSRVLRLTDDGEALARRLAPAWDALSAAAVELDAEARDVLAALDRLEAALDRSSILERSRRILDSARP
ncbi:MarR family winged helix-turn-helix transcriptional regulator [Caulobacter sp. UNC358MFTsu5.1]|uniref:MarR family winged helix-turn-helix transcriptional regulator n=1 Tax=Caulobacter sp. UNC358MFTsu5.1 TaxID=1449049 RepID=UPI00054D45F9|nr:MarR family transcriptional regulator [Caulobacter sp. UNC358MFTsu5.1]